MKIVDNNLDGVSVILSTTESIEKVPDNYQKLVSEPLRSAFEDPQAFIEESIVRCKISSVKKFLKTLRNHEGCDLEVHQDKNFECQLAGLRFWLNQDFGILVAPSNGRINPHLPAPLKHLYEEFDSIHWSEYGESGGFYNCNHAPLSDIFTDFEPSDEDYDDLYVWGDCLSGHPLVWSSSNISGWFMIHRFEVVEMGTIDDGISYIFNELANGQEPDPYSKFC